MTATLYNVMISRKAILNNIKVLTKDAKLFFAVIKADAYGHGLVETAKTCLSSDEAEKMYAFAVGCIDEALILRKAGIAHKPILALLGIYPKKENEIVKAKDVDLTVLVHDKESLRTALDNNLSFALKWNTGMNRFGFNIEDLPEVLNYIKSQKNAKCELHLSHLATAEELSEFEESFTSLQLENFDTIIQEVVKDFPKVKFSLGQSAHILNRSSKAENIVRLGVSMYGVNPFYGTEKESHASALQPVMSVSAPILAVNTIEKGQSVGYGQKFRFEKKSEVAVLGIGYADGYRRQYFSSVSNSDKSKNTIMYACYNGIRVPLVGSICMQVSFFDVTGLNAKVGDTMYLLGGESEKAIRAEELSSWWGTIPYEPMCVFGKIEEKIYI